MARLSLGLLAALVVLAPLFRAGKVPLGLMTLELLALAGLLVFFFHREGRPNLPLAEKLLLGALVLFPLLQLVPLPGVSRAQLPGQADMYLDLQAAGVEEGWATLSTLPRETLAGWLVLLVPVAVFLLTRSLPVNWLRGVLVVMFWMAGFKYARASIAAILNQMTIIFAFILAALFLMEGFGARKADAATLAIVGVLMVTLV